MRVWPADYDSDCYVLLPVPVATIPIIGGLLSELEKQEAWASESDWEQGYQFAVCLQRCLVECGQSFSEVMTLLAVSLGANEIAEADLSPVFPALAARLAAARVADSAGVLAKVDAAKDETPSPIIRFEDIARLQQGKFPDTGSLWWYKPGEPVTLYDLYQQAAGLSDDPGDPDGRDWWDYLTDLVDMGSDLKDILDATGLTPGKLKKDGLMIGLIAIEAMNLAMNSNILLNLVGHNKIINNSPGAPAATHDYLEAILKSTRGMGIQRSETDWAGSYAGVGRPPTDTPPPDSVLWALRGVDDAAKQATDTRNVIDKLGSTAIDLSTVEGSLSTIATNTGATATNTGATATNTAALATKFDALLQGSALGDGRVNLWALDQRINDVIIELQSGQIFSKLSILLQNSPAAGAVNLYELWQEIYKIIKNDNDPNVVNFEDVKDGLDEINKRLGWLMGDPDHPLPSDNLTDLYDLLLQLQCICLTNRKYLPLILGNMPDEVPIIIDDGDGIIAPPATTTPAPANICQLARWFFSKIRYVITNMCATSAPSRSTLALLYFAHFNVDIPQEYVVRLTTMINSYVNSSEAHNHLAMLDYLNGLENELICALYDAANSASAKGAWDTLMDSKGAEALAAPTIVKHSVWNGLLTELYEGNIPRNPADLIGYSSDCSGCSGGTGGGGNIYNIDMVRYSLTDRGAAPYAVPDPPDGDDQTWYFLVWQPDMRVWQSTGDDWDGVIAYKSNTSGTITGWPTLPDLTPFISNGAGMSGWSIKCNYDQSQNPDPLYDVYFASDPDNVDDLAAGTLITTTWQPLPATGRVCVYCKGGLNGANQWLLIQLQAP